MKAIVEAGKPLVLFSIRPKYCLMFTDGTKRVEIRKTRPKIEPPFTGLIYCTKDYSLGEWFLPGAEFCDEPLQGKVIGEFTCNRIDEVYQCNSGWVQENACLSRDEFFDYLGIPRDTHLGYDKKAYAFHVSDLTIYDKPKDLRKFGKYGFDHAVPLRRPPQSWCYAERL